MVKTFDEKKQQILKTAIALFREKGYKNVSVMDICNACGITKPTFYKFVISKENIISEIYLDEEAEILPAVKKLEEAGKDLEALWLGLTGTFALTHYLGPEIFFTHYCTNLRYNIPDHNYLENTQAIMVPLVEKLQNESVINNPSSPRDLYLVLVNLFLGLCCEWASSEGKSDLLNDYRKAISPILGIREDDEITLMSAERTADQLSSRFIEISKQY